MRLRRAGATTQTPRRGGRCPHCLEHAVRARTCVTQADAPAVRRQCARRRPLPPFGLWRARARLLLRARATLYFPHRTRVFPAHCCAPKPLSVAPNRPRLRPVARAGESAPICCTGNRASPPSPAKRAVPPLSPTRQHGVLPVLKPSVLAAHAQQHAEGASSRQASCAPALGRTRARQQAAAALRHGRAARPQKKTCGWGCERGLRLQVWGGAGARV